MLVTVHRKQKNELPWKKQLELQRSRQGSREQSSKCFNKGSRRKRSVADYSAC